MAWTIDSDTVPVTGSPVEQTVYYCVKMVGVPVEERVDGAWGRWVEDTETFYTAADAYQRACYLNTP